MDRNDDIRIKRLGLLAGIITAAAAGLMLQGCNTMEGAGEDLEDAGDAISDEARDNN